MEVVEGDALEIDWAALAGPSYLLAGNLPYYITTPLIFRVLATPRPRRAVLLVQREVAQRLVAAPGSDDYGALTVNVQVTASVRVVSRVSAGAFHPKPRVDSAIILVTPLAEPLLGADEEEPFRRFVQAAFGMRRKTLLRVVRELWVPDAGLASDILASLRLDTIVATGSPQSGGLCASLSAPPYAELTIKGNTRTTKITRYTKSEAVPSCSSCASWFNVGASGLDRRRGVYFSRLDRMKLNPSSSIAMLTLRTETSAGVWSCVGAKFRIAFTPAWISRSAASCASAHRNGEDGDVGLILGRCPSRRRPCPRRGSSPTACRSSSGPYRRPHVTRKPRCSNP